MNEFIKITGRPEGKRYVISDIHGCYKTFRSLVEEKIMLAKTDWLFLLGDYLDRGPLSKKVLDYILELKDNGYTIFPLRGNHEEDLLEYALEESRFLNWHVNKQNYPNIVRENKLIDCYLEFFESLPYYYELDDYYLVHAVFNFNSEKPFEDKTAMLWTRNFNPSPSRLNGKRIIHGHEPAYLMKIKMHIEKQYPTIPLDNGAVYTGKHKIYDTSQLGNLCAYDLDSGLLFTQKNIDKT